MRLNDGVPTPNPLRDHLISSASVTAKTALDRVSGVLLEDSTTLFLNAGMTVEFLLRAVVADMSPALLFVSRNGGDLAALAMTRAHRDTAVDKGWLLQQKSAELSFIRPIALRIVPALADHAATLTDTINRRNAAAHMYIVDGEARRVTLTGMVRVADVMLAYFGTTGDGFWGAERAALVQSLLAEGADATRADVELAIHTARLYVAEVKAGLSPAERERVLSTLEAQGSPFFPPGPSEVVRDTCPACERQAELVLRLVDDTSDFNAVELIEWSADGIPGAALIPQEPVSVQLQCPVCRLHLTFAELQAAYPNLADLTSYEVEPRRGTMSEYEDLVIVNEPY